MSLLYRLKLKMAKYHMRRLNKLYAESQNFNTAGAEVEIKWEEVTKLSEGLNEYAKGFDMWTDTTALIPGLIVYVIGKREPTAEKPYITYKPEPRVIVQIHDSGVNGGTVFFTYSHRINKPQSIIKKETDFTIVSEETVIYSPLTLGHAEHICKLLNLQSKLLYEKNLLKFQNKEQKQK